MWSPELSSHFVSSVTSYCISNRTKGSWVLGHERGGLARASGELWGQGQGRRAFLMGY